MPYIQEVGNQTEKLPISTLLDLWYNGGDKIANKDSCGMEIMENVVFRRATVEEMPRVIQMQSDVFSGEQGIPSDALDVFMEKSCRVQTQS